MKNNKKSFRNLFFCKLMMAITVINMASSVKSSDFLNKFTTIMGSTVFFASITGIVSLNVYKVYKYYQIPYNQRNNQTSSYNSNITINGRSLKCIHSEPELSTSSLVFLGTLGFFAMVVDRNKLNAILS